MRASVSTMADIQLSTDGYQIFAGKNVDFIDKWCDSSIQCFGRV